MRLQLATRIAGVISLVVALAPVVAWAEVEGTTRVTFFREPSSRNEGISVIHPQADVSAGIGGAFAATAGYELDIVSGATPRTYRPTGLTTVDAVSGATKFSDTRQAARGGLSFQTAAIGVNAGYSYGFEKDYKSHTLQVGARGDFLDRNFTLGLAYTRNFDSVCDANNGAAQGPLDLKPLAQSDRCFQGNQTETVTRGVDIDTFEPSLLWTATPRLILQAGGTLQILNGFQSNPYRTVLVGQQGRTPQERVPQFRQRYAAFLRALWAIPALRASISIGGRIYRDTWDLDAATGELVVQKYLASSLLVTARGRYHQQDSANFYRNARDYVLKGPAGQYWTGDRELSPLSSLLGGFKVAYLRKREQNPDAFFDELEVNVKMEALFYRLEVDAPNADRSTALIFQLGLAARF